MTIRATDEPCERYGDYWRLPGHPDVLFDVNEEGTTPPGTTETHWEITYVGLGEELIELGICTADMLAPIAKTDRRAKRFDSAGDYYRRESYFVSRGGKPATRWKLRLYKPRSRAVLLPGAESLIVADELEGAAERRRVLEQPAGIVVEADEWRYRLVGTRETLSAAGFGDSFTDRSGLGRAWPTGGGLYLIIVQKPCSDPDTNPDRVRLAEELLQRGSRPFLRLVVDNTGKQPSG